MQKGARFARSTFVESRGDAGSRAAEADAVARRDIGQRMDGMQGSVTSMSAVRAILFALIAGLAGCQFSALKDAQPDFPCTQLHEEFLGDAIKKVTGCGIENVYGYTNDRWQSPKERAAFDMDCPRDKLQAHDLGSRTVGITAVWSFSTCGTPRVWCRS